MFLKKSIKGYLILSFVGFTTSYCDHHAKGFLAFEAKTSNTLFNVGCDIFNSGKDYIGSVLLFSDFYTFIFNCLINSFDQGFGLFVLLSRNYYFYRLRFISRRKSKFKATNKKRKSAKKRFLGFIFKYEV